MTNNSKHGGERALEALDTPLEAAEKIMQSWAMGWDIAHPAVAVWADTVKAALTHPPAVEALQWQPIESAPRDGTTLLGAFKGGKVASIEWLTDKGYVEGWALSGSMQNNMRPTHWMPLPEPPKEGE